MGCGRERSEFVHRRLVERWEGLLLEEKERYLELSWCGGASSPRTTSSPTMTTATTTTDTITATIAAKAPTTERPPNVFLKDLSQDEKDKLMEDLRNVGIFAPNRLTKANLLLECQKRRVVLPPQSNNCTKLELLYYLVK